MPTELITLAFINEENKDIRLNQVLSFLEADFNTKVAATNNGLDLIPKNIPHFWHNKDIIKQAFFQESAMVAINNQQQIIAFLTWSRFSDFQAVIDIIDVIPSYNKQEAAERMINALVTKFSDICVLTTYALPSELDFYDQARWKGTSKQRRLYKPVRPHLAPSKTLTDGCIIAVCAYDFYMVQKNRDLFANSMQYYKVSFNKPGELTTPIVAPFNNEGYIAIYYNQRRITEGKAKHLFHDGQSIDILGSQVLTLKTFMPKQPELFAGTEFNVDYSKTYNPLDTSKLFHTKFSSAFKITNVARDKEIIKEQVRIGWKWVYPNWMNLQIDPLLNMSEGDWIITEGKTLRLIKTNTTVADDIAILKYLTKQPIQHFKKHNKTANHEREKVQKNYIRASTQTVDVTDCTRGILLQKGLFTHSYSRLAGAYKRHIERLPKLQYIFTHFFNLTHVNKDITVELYNKPPKHYTNIQIVTLTPRSLTRTSLQEISSACGISINPEVLRETSNIENTIPFKKVLEVLTVYNSTNRAPIEPWLVQLRLFNRNVEFLISQNNDQPTQLMVSMEATPGKFVGNGYTYWFNPQVNPVDAKAIAESWSLPIASITQPVPENAWRNLIEFIVCTQVVEAHCNVDHIDESRVPGTAKLARMITAQQDKKTLEASFNRQHHNPQLFFPMAGNGGTGITRDAANSLQRPIPGADCNNMSDDSDCDAGVSP